MKHIARTVTEWVKGNRPSVTITIEADSHGRSALATWAVQFCVWALPALVATDRIGNVLIAFAVAAPMVLVLSRAIYVGPAVAVEPEPADLPA